MESLRRRDFRAALDFIALLGEATGLDDFASRVAFELKGVIACHSGSYNEFNFRRRRVRWITNVETGPADVQAFELHMARNPLLDYIAAQPLGPAARSSDLVSQRQWRSLGVYRDLYHPLGFEQALVIEIANRPAKIGIGAFRDGGDFSDRDRTMMTMLRPHLMSAYRHAALTSDLNSRIGLLESGIEIGGLGAIEIGTGGNVRWMNATARSWLAAYFHAVPTQDRLPDEVAAWLRRGDNPSSAAETMPEAAAPLVVNRGDARLVLRRLRHAGRVLILLREERTTVTAEDLAALGLARREAEILAWVALGKTDAEIAAILALSRRTVSHTLERVYRKLGVESRMAATMRAFRAVRAASDA